MLLCGAFQLTFGEILNCQFIENRFNIGSVYTCVVVSLDNSNNNMVITEHNGIHKTNKNDAVVKAIYIYSTNVKFIPDNLGLLFNLTVFAMSNTQLVEIKDKNFQAMENLEEIQLNNNGLSSVPFNAFTKLTKLKILHLNSNEIEDLPNGLFRNNLNLVTIHLYSNKITSIASTLFDGLTKLDIVDLSNNICIKNYYIMSTIVELKNEIKTNCFNQNENAIIPSTTTPNPIEMQEKISNLTIELIKAKKELNKLQIDLAVTATNAQQNDQSKLNQVIKELYDAMKRLQKNQIELIECNSKTKKLSEQVSDLDQNGYKHLYDELLQVKEKQQQDGIETNQQHKVMTENTNEKLNEMMTKLMKAITEQQTNRVENENLKNELIEAKNQHERQRHELNKIRLQMDELNKTNSELLRQTFDVNKEIFDVKEERRV